MKIDPLILAANVFIPATASPNTESTTYHLTNQQRDNINNTPNTLSLSRTPSTSFSPMSNNIFKSPSFLNRINNTPLSWKALFSDYPKQQDQLISLATRIEPAMEQEGLDRIATVKLLKCWCEPHRHYHNLNHLEQLLNQIDCADDLSQLDRNLLKIIALTHDAAYNIEPNAYGFTNEALSVNLYHESLHPGLSANPIIDHAITATENRTPPSNPDFPLSQRFWAMDNTILYNSTMSDKNDWEANIKAEYEPIHGESDYIQGRLTFLKMCLKETDPSLFSIYTDDSDRQQQMHQTFVSHIQQLIDQLASTAP